jgi:Voltage gated chloride channel
MEDGLRKIPGGAYVQNIIGMGVIGLMMVALQNRFGHTYVDGVGYGVIQSVLDQSMTAAGLLALLFVLKLFATTISLGSGTSGGIFSPSLYLGATLGASFASFAIMILPNAGMTTPSAAIVGMAAMAGAGTGGVMTAIIMVFEMTRDYAIIVPVIVAVAVASGVRRALISETAPRARLPNWAGRPRHAETLLADLRAGVGASDSSKKSSSCLTMKSGFSAVSQWPHSGITPPVTLLASASIPVCTMLLENAAPPKASTGIFSGSCAYSRLCSASVQWV